jgi:phosphate transport system permease protein
MAASTTLPPAQDAEAVFDLRRKSSLRLQWEKLLRSTTFMASLLSVVVTLGILGVLLSQSIPFFFKVSPLEFFGGTEWSPSAGKFGVLPLVVSTLMITLGSAIIALPLGVLVGVFLAEYASPGVRKVLKPALELLAGIPTVVYGYFALTGVTPLLKKVLPELQPFNTLSASIVVGIMTLPLVSSLCEDAIASVPRALREGSLALGATRSETMRKVMIPAALSGIIASFILAVSRAIGEVMAVTMAAGSRPVLTFDPQQGAMTMTSAIVTVSKGDVARGTPQYQTIFAIGLTLFVITFGLNILARYLVAKYRLKT